MKNGFITKIQRRGNHGDNTDVDRNQLGSFTLSDTTSHYYMFQSMVHGLSEQLFTSDEVTKNQVDLCMNPEKWEKVVPNDFQLT